MIYNFSVENKIRLDEFLRENLPNCVKNQEISNSKIRRLIIAGSVFVNNSQIRRPAYIVFPKSKISVNFDENKFFYEKQPDDIKYEVTQKDVLFEDEYLIVINKPSLFPTEETIVGGQKRDNLHQAVIRWIWKNNPSLRNPPYVGIMHRLDRETSGAILFTKQRCVNNDIHKMFEEHSVKKIYHAIAVTNKKNQIKDSFFIENYMGRISPKSSAAKWGFVPEKNGGLYSKTEFKILNKSNYKDMDLFYIEAQLKTGRTHQIRVHLSSAGLPLLGDELYGGIPEKRIMLHSKCLEFIHPITKKELKINAPIPDFFNKYYNL